MVPHVVAARKQNFIIAGDAEPLGMLYSLIKL